MRISTGPPPARATRSTCSAVPYSSSSPWIARTGQAMPGSLRDLRADDLARRQYEVLQGTIAVRDALGRSPDGEAPRLTHVAATLGVSTRTLKRKLAQGGTSFRALLLESQLRRARHLLAHTQLRVAEVAHRLGYENPANFSRAFTQSTGESPSAYRARTAPSGLR